MSAVAVEAGNVYELAAELTERYMEAEPLALAALLMEECDEQQREMLVEVGAQTVARNFLHRVRRIRPRAVDRVRAGGGEFDLGRVSVYDGERHLWLLDCSCEFMVAAADRQRDEADAHTVIEQRYRAIAALFAAHPEALTVGELPRGAVEAAYGG